MHTLEGVIGNKCDAIITFARNANIPRIPTLDSDVAQIVQVLVKNFNAMTLAVDDVEVLLCVDCQFVWKIPLTRARALVARTAGTFRNLLEHLASLVEHQYAVIAITVGHDDVAV